MRRAPVGRYVLTSTHRDARNHWTGSNHDKYEAAREAVAAFGRAYKDSCVFGSLAFKLLGVECRPNDVDLIVLDTTQSLEDLKECLVHEHSESRFYLMPARNRRANYRLLWYATRRGARVKVDILQPGEMSIPSFDASLISEGVPPGRAGSGPTIPVAPLELVLLLKLQGWEVHSKSNLRHLREKEHEDVNQIRSLLAIYKSAFNFEYLPDDMMGIAGEQIEEYVIQYPRSIGSWRRVGLYY